MRPLPVTATTIVSAMGRGAAATLDAVRERRSGLRPCDFGGVATGYIGRVDGVEAHALPADLERFDCRNNRLADMALQTDGFADAVACRHRPLRRPPHRGRARHEHVGRALRRGRLSRPRSGDRRASGGVRSRAHPRHVLLGALPARGSGRAGTRARRLDRLRVEFEEPHRCLPPPRDRHLRRGDRRRSGLALPHDAPRIRRARTSVARALPALRRGPGRHLHRRGCGLRAAGARRMLRLCAPRLRRHERRLSHVLSASRRRGRDRSDARGPAQGRL